ncbi:MAG: hypothetical protein HYY63_03080 [Elusimicrobia bacterium]|nr:hypothetical protein [Elusimicrobiota bacterium]
MNGQAKLSQSVTASKTENLDGSKSWMGLEGKGQAMEVNYRYYGEAGFPADNSQKRFFGSIARAGGNGRSLSDDGFGNLTNSNISQDFKILNGQAKISRSVTSSKTENLDGSLSWMGMEGQGEAMVVDYEYYGESGNTPNNAEKKFLGSVAKATGRGRSISDDGFGNVTTSNISQEFKVINGQAKMAKSVTASKTENLDGSKNWMGMDGKGQQMEVNYRYYGEEGFAADNSQKKFIGSVARAAGNGQSFSDDGFGNITNSSIAQDFKVINGQAKLSRSVTASKTENVDGSISWMGVEGKGEAMSVEYAYYGEPGLTPIPSEKKYIGSTARATGRGASISDDGYGNLTTSNITQEFRVINGQAKLSKSITTSKTENLDGSKSWMGAEGKGQAMEVTYRYYGEDGFPADSSKKRNLGSVAEARGSGTSLSDDGFGNVTTSNISQEFKVINGQAKIARSVTASRTENIDGSFNLMGMNRKGETMGDGIQGKAMEVIYRYYGEEGYKPDSSQRKHLGSVAFSQGEGSSVTDDGFGNVTTSNF